MNLVLHALAEGRPLGRPERPRELQIAGDEVAHGGVHVGCPAPSQWLASKWASIASRIAASPRICGTVRPDVFM